MLHAGMDGRASVTFKSGKFWWLVYRFTDTTIVVGAKSNVYATTPSGVFQLEKK